MLVVAGSVGAAYVETEYVFWEHFTGAATAVASPDLALDLLETMPWYILLVIFLSVALMSDGLLGSFIGGNPLDELAVPPRPRPDIHTRLFTDNRAARPGRAQIL